MSYWSDWYSDNLEANQIYTALIYFGEQQDPTYKESNLTPDITPTNNLINKGASENDLFNALSQESIQLEVYNGSRKYESVDFSHLKTLRLSIDAYNIDENSYRWTFRNCINNSVVKNDDYITLNYNLLNVNRLKPTWAQLTNTTYPTVATMFTALCTAIGMTGTNDGDSNLQITPFPINQNFQHEYQLSTWGDITTVGELANQIAQIEGCYVEINNGVSPTCNIKKFPKNILNREIEAYVYGGTFDETEESSYQTGDSLDGNTDTLNGGAFDNDYKVINDDVLINLEIGETYQPTGIIANIPKWTIEDDEVSGEDYEYKVGTDDTLIDMTSNNLLKLAMAHVGSIDFAAILTQIFNNLNFPSANFEATILNNMAFDIGDVVAISTGTNPTKYSYIENITTNIFGTTVLSNKRGD